MNNCSIILIDFMLGHPSIQYTAFLTAKADIKTMYEALFGISDIEIYPVEGGKGDNILIKITAENLETISDIHKKILRKSREYDPNFHPTLSVPVIANPYFKPIKKEKVEISEIVQPVQTSNQ